MASSIAEALQQSLRPVRGRCRVDDFIRSLSDEDRTDFERMFEVLSPHMTRKALMTVDGLDSSAIPSASTFKRHRDRECSCRD